MSTHKPTVKSTTLSHRCPSSVEKAQLDFFIALGSMEDLDPTNHFSSILNLGNAIIAGDLAAVSNALSFYKDHTSLLFEHMDFLERALNSSEVTFPEPEVIKYEGSLGQTKTALVLAILLERSQKIAYVSSDPCLASYVQAFTRNRIGIMSMEPSTEDPQLLLKHIGRVICLPDPKEPPPMSCTTMQSAVA